MFRMWAYIPALAATCMLPLLAQDIFVTPGQSAATTIGVFRADPFTSAGSIAGPASAFQVLRAGASKFYVISRAGVDTVTVYEGTIPAVNQTKRFNLNQPATAAAVSPDGRRVIVLAGSAYIFDTSTDTNLTPSGISVGNEPSSVAVSLDSSRAFVLSPSTQRLSAIDLSTSTVASTTTVPGTGSEVAAAPNGFIYVTAPNALLEYDARTLTNTNTISLNAFPSRLAFTPDGRGALLVNTNPITGSSLIHVDLLTRTFVVAPPLGSGATLSDVVVTSPTTAYAFSPQTGRVYSTQLTPGGTTPLTLTQVSFGSVAVEDVRDIAVSPEVPARYVYVVSGVGLFRIDSTGNVTGPAQLPVVGDISVAPAPVTTGATNVTALNATQSIAADQTSRPLIIRVTDASGNPVSGAAVTFTANLPGASIVNAMATTNNLGIATAQVTPPTSTPSGTITVNAAVAGVPAAGAFTVNFGTTSPGGGTSSGVLEIVSGNGQVLGQFQTTANQEPLRVRARDAAGRVLPGINVTWTVTQGQGGSISPSATTTDENGIASANFVSNLVSPGVPFVTSIVTASTGTENASFYLTTLANSPGGALGSLNAYRRETPDVIEARAGQTIPAAIKYDVVSPVGARLPFIGIRVETDVKDGEGRNVAQCQGGTQLSDQEGVAKCDLVVGPFVGETPITVTVGSVKVDRYQLIVRAGELSTLSIVQGNNQTGAPGANLPLALIVEAKDSLGNILPGVPVQWENLTPTLANMTNRVDTTDVNGRASVNVVLGQNAGAVQIRARAGNASQTFSLSISVPVSTLRIEGGNNQNAAVSTAFAQPLSVAVLNAQGQPVQGAQVTFAVASGSTGAVTLASPTATSNAQGIASTTVTAGSTTGAVTVTASSGSVSQSFTLTVRPVGPGFTAASIVNGAGFQPGISPGSIASINVSGIVPNLRGTVTGTSLVGPLPTQLEGVEVLFNGIAAPIYAVSNINGQESVNVQVPFEVTPGSASVTIRSTTGGSTTVSGVQILPLKPGLFEFTEAGGQRYAVAVRPDGSYVSSANPARRGEIIRVFATGLGQVSPATGTNRAGLINEVQSVLAPVIVGVNNEGVRVVSSQLQPGVVGVYVIAFEVPANTTTGTSRPFAIAVVGGDGQVVFGNGSAIPIQ
jgi:adhesin/invasin